MHYLYRHFDSEDKLLYVGISLSAINRLSQHKGNSAWFASIKRVEVESFQTKGEALMAERMAITREEPLHNVQWSPTKKSVGKPSPSGLVVFGALSLLQRKLTNALLHHAQPDLMAKNGHEIGMGYLSELIGFNSHDFIRFKEALHGLAHESVEWGLRRKAGLIETWGILPVLAEVQIDGKAGICRYAYDPLLREKLYNLGVRATINLDIQKKFGSKYALALYENCVRCRDMGSIDWMGVETFRQMLGCDTQAHYQEFKHLNNLVIKPAIREVNETSDIEVTPEYKRQSRKVQSVRMKIADKRDLPPLKGGKAKAKPAEDAARISTMVDEVAVREKAAQDQAAAEKAIQEMKALFKPAQ